MLELKSLITLSIFLFSHSLAIADPIPNPDPQFDWFGNGNQNGNRNGNRNGNGQQQGPQWGQPQQSQQQGPQWGNPNQNNPYQTVTPYQNNPYQNNPYQNNPYQNNPYQNNPYPNNGNNPYQNNNPYQQQPQPRPGSNPTYPQQTARPGNGQNGGQRPTATTRTTTIRPTPTRDPDDDEVAGPRWTPPPNWGPRTTPFGPKQPPKTVTVTTPPAKPKPTGTRPAYCSNTDLICTTTIDEPKEPVPYAVTCGKTRFNEYDVTNALNTGCYYWKKNQKIAGTEFPKLFNNARFDFGEIKGPFYEFPLIDSAAYVSGPPGVHRVIFSTPDCFLAGEITGEGQRANTYTECTEEF